MRICTHICIICLYAHIYAHTRAYVQICPHIHSYLLISAYMCAYMRIYAHICVYAHMRAHMHRRGHMCGYAHPLMFAYICLYARISAYMHASWSPPRHKQNDRFKKLIGGWGFLDHGFLNNSWTMAYGRQKNCFVHKKQYRNLATKRRMFFERAGLGTTEKYFCTLQKKYKHIYADMGGYTHMSVHMCIYAHIRIYAYMRAHRR